MLSRARILAALPAALLLAACGPSPRPPGAPALEHAAYVWAPKWGPETSLAVAADRLPEEVRRLRVYVGSTHQAEGHRAFPVDWPALVRSGRHLSLVVAVGPASANFRDEPDLGPAGDLLAEAVAAARAAEAPVVRVQLEVDCPPGKLAGYASALEAFRRRFPGLELAVSVLPAWLERPDVTLVVAQADRFTLHLSPGYALGGGHGRPDFRSAERWVADAARLGRPFRVGIPITSHFLCYDANGGLLASVPVGRSAPAGTARAEPVVADPVALPAFVRRMETHSPGLLEGLDWMRLPVPGDAGTWSREGMVAALRGEPVRRAAKAVLVPEDAITRVVVANDGMVPVPAPAVRVSWKTGQVQACDAVAPWEIHLSASAGFRLLPGEGASLVPAGESSTAGWVRFAAPPEGLDAALAER